MRGFGRKMRQRPFALTLALAGLLLFDGEAARGENILAKNNGLGAVALGSVGLKLGAMALAPPATWEGYPKTLGERPFIGDATAGRRDGCAVSHANMIAKALLAPENSPPIQTAPLHLSEVSRQTDMKSFDEKAIYDPAQTSICPQPPP
jgi:hypothetical protein